MSAIIAHEGPEKARPGPGLLDNLARKPEGADIDQLRGLVLRQCDLAVVITFRHSRPDAGGECPEVSAAIPI